MINGHLHVTAALTLEKNSRSSIMERWRVPRVCVEDL
jgi:hypothetical protein